MKRSIAIIAALYLIVAMMGWNLYRTEKLQTQETIRARLQARESDAFAAWQYASRWELIKVPIFTSEPKKDENLFRRDVWVKVYQKADVKFIGKSTKYGNDSFALTTLVAFNNRGDKTLIERAEKRPPFKMDLIVYLLRGVWHHLSMQCRVDKLDGPGEWIASERTPHSDPKYLN